MVGLTIARYGDAFPRPGGAVRWQKSNGGARLHASSQSWEDARLAGNALRGRHPDWQPRGPDHARRARPARGGPRGLRGHAPDRPPAAGAPDLDPHHIVLRAQRALEGGTDPEPAPRRP